MSVDTEDKWCCWTRSQQISLHRWAYFCDERRDVVVVGDARDGGLGEGGLGDGLGDTAELGGGRRQTDGGGGRGALHGDAHAALRRLRVQAGARTAQEVGRYHRLELLVCDRPRRLRV